MASFDSKHYLESLEADKTTESQKEYLTFNVNKEIFGIDILKIHEILKPVPITRIPNGGDYILGVINLRGEIIPIIDLKQVFGIGYSDIIPSTRIIVVVQDEKRAGILVDTVRQVVKIQYDKINSNTTDDLTLNYSSLIESVSQADETLILNLNLSVLINFEREEI
ncbi:chemotaxis protein CheW [Leptospira borgpetersenii]|uniref:Chemotaxis signal transduction protein n=3 Tax=Leptospira borgpetersenii TaxID=174 RepID=Q04U50_LEPBJ|nr:chemotaxis protein CheW [Leptospira borgpetersenii]EMO63889.1 CheW-like protein [Leptospira borgpetersenii serovar Pomona str. 200901868]ABJ75570.1 Chemotaxis signal transduction protein [Leptospira borgpetersenii serovar Hardjo-bovis str. JB197]ABJ79520.1 Chemotaxis signal transduction protein [Leptospira borgpetersenii serovar Hardjo-bovis str. L550]AMX58859.1 chemotaxis protein CheW [Leptospira borgpetersenii serovar Hardjo]AMX62113.1 chemotaxis protein CheW [Leptospira borgpetersenii se